MPGNCTAHGSLLSRERTYPRSSPPNTRDNAVKIFGSAMGGPHFGHRAWHQGPLGDLSHRAGPSLQEGKVTAADRASAQGTARKGLGHGQAAQCSSPESARVSPRRGEEGFEHSAPQCCASGMLPVAAPSCHSFSRAGCPPFTQPSRGGLESPTSKCGGRRVVGWDMESAGPARRTAMGTVEDSNDRECRKQG